LSHKALRIDEQTIFGHTKPATLAKYQGMMVLRIRNLMQTSGVALARYQSTRMPTLLWPSTKVR
jgi:hypothetical protein